MTGILAKIRRRASRYVSRRDLPVAQRSIVSFGFDDCPRSVLETALPLLEAEGWKATIYIAMGLCGTTNHLGEHLSAKDVQDIAARGHEIADHTYSHLSALSASPEILLADIERNQSTLTELGLPASRHFALPYGDISPSVKRALSTRFLTTRGVITPALDERLDANLMTAMRLYSGEATDAILERISILPKKAEWLNLFSHDVRDKPSQFGCTANDLKRVITALRENKITVLSVADAYDEIVAPREVTA